MTLVMIRIWHSREGSHLEFVIYANDAYDAFRVRVIQTTAHRNTLQCTATHCNTL